MPEDPLDPDDVAAVCDAPRRKGVTQTVKRDFLRETRSVSNFSKRLRRCVKLERPPLLVRKDESLIAIHS
jgi:hypothetical protein